MSSLSTPSIAGAPPILAARGIARTDPLVGAVLLQPATLELFGGDQLVVSGASGAGKSVLMRSLAMLDPLSAGTVLLHGEAVEAAAIPAFRAQVAYLRQRPSMLPGTVEDNLRFPYTLAAHCRRSYSRARALALLAAAGKPAGFLDKQARDLSGGEAQIVALIRTLQLDPAVLLLDEPTAALDPEATAVIEKMVLDWAAGRLDEPGGAASRKAATAWITHSPAQEARIGNRHFRMHAGLLSEAPPAQAAS